jgi:3-hydroxyacyl-CoA dehydrogenase
MREDITSVDQTLTCRKTSRNKLGSFMNHCTLVWFLITVPRLPMQKCDMVIEAVIEDIPLKQRIFAGKFAVVQGQLHEGW